MAGWLVLANFLASVAGGRVLSAGKGLTDLRVLGSGSLMALLAGSVISLLILGIARRVRHGGGVIRVSGASVVCSALLLWLYRLGTASGIGRAAGESILSGSLALAFFAILAIRCALWFAGRSLRTGLVAAYSRPAIGMAEAAYFAGLVAGLVIGLPAWFGGDAVTSAFALDIVILSAVTLIDWRSAKAVAHAPGQAARPTGRLDRHFALVTGAYASATVACQIVVFHLADNVARLPASSGARAWADPTLASFYVGVAVLASCGRRLRPRLVAGQGGAAAVAWQLRGRSLASPVWLICGATAALVLAGTSMVWTWLTRATWPTGVVAGLALIALAAAVFELLILGLLAELSVRGSAAVALALGMAGSLATGAMFLMLLGGSAGVVRTVASIVGLSLAACLLRGWARQARPSTK